MRSSYDAAAGYCGWAVSGRPIVASAWAFERISDFSRCDSSNEPDDELVLAFGTIRLLDDMRHEADCFADAAATKSSDARCDIKLFPSSMTRTVPR
jgi:hypothetical protein